jgi:hypothetical protein
VKIRHQEQLYDELTKDISWRKKELASIRTLLSKNKNLSKDTILRAGIALTYAHFEGSIKHSASIYLNYLNYTRLKLSDATPSVIAMEIKAQLSNAVNTQNIEELIKVVNLLLNKPDEKCSNLLNYKIDTGANLNFTRLKNIAIALNLGYESYEPLEKIINENLLSNRNSIAHGDYLTIDENGFLDLQSKILKIMEQFMESITQAAATKSYMK